MLAVMSQSPPQDAIQTRYRCTPLLSACSKVNTWTVDEQNLIQCMELIHKEIRIFWGSFLTKLLAPSHMSWVFDLFNEYIKVKVKWSRYRPGVAQRVGRGIALLFHDRGTRRGWVVSSTPRPHFTPGKEPVLYPLYRRLGGPQGRSGWAENLVPSGIRSRTVQPVVSRYMDWATRPTI